MDFKNILSNYILRFLNNFKDFCTLPINLILSYKSKFIVGKVKIIFVWVTIISHRKHSSILCFIILWFSKFLLLKYC